MFAPIRRPKQVKLRKIAPSLRLWKVQDFGNDAISNKSDRKSLTCPQKVRAQV